MSEKRERELWLVRRQILVCLQTTQCWEDCKLAADALFHVRLIWGRYDSACQRDEAQNENSAEPSDAELRLDGEVKP